MSTLKKSPATIGLAFATALSTAGCVTTVSPSGTYMEDANYNGQRTRIQQPVDCTITTTRSGEVYGGSTRQVGPGSFTETCVSSPHAGQRQRGTDPVNSIVTSAQRTMQQQIQNKINREIYDLFR